MSRPPYHRGDRGTGRYWTEERIHASIHAWVEKHGRAPTTIEWQKATPDHPGQATIWKNAGRFRSVIEACGYEPARVGGRFSERPRRLWFSPGRAQGGKREGW